MAATPHLLVVEDDRETRDLVARYLTGRGFRVTTARNGVEMRQALEAGNFNLMLLDLMLPGEDGLTICRKLRAEKSTLPIIMLTALGEEADRIVGLEGGADDYLPKPFSPRELVARLHAVLRRSRPVDEDRLQLGPVSVDVTRRRVYAHDDEIHLTPTEFDLLTHLLRAPGRVWTRDELLSAVWGYGGGSGRTVDVHVAQLRAKLGAAAPLRTVRGVGYAADERGGDV